MTEAKTYGKDFVPWGTHINIGGAPVTSGNGVLGAWTEITASCSYAFYPTTVAMRSLYLGSAFEVGYGPSGAERTIAAGLLGTPLPSTNYIPKGSRVVARWASTGANSAVLAVSGIRADAWGPDPVKVGPKNQAVTPSLLLVTATTTGAQLVAALPYPFVLTTAYFLGLTGTNNSQAISIRAGAAGSEVPIVYFHAARGDNALYGFFNFLPRPLPIAAGTRLSAWTDNATCSVNIAGYRLDY